MARFSQLLRHRAPRHVGECCCQHPSRRAKFHHEASAAQLTCASERCQTRKPQSRPKLAQKKNSKEQILCMCVPIAPTLRFTSLYLHAASKQ